MWWRKEAITSSAVTFLPLWKVAPLRSLNTQLLASSPGSKLSGEIRNDLALGIDLGEAVAHRAPAHRAGHLIGIGGGIE